MCSTWKSHIESQKKGLKPITDARNFKLTDLVGRPELREETPPTDSGIRQAREKWIIETEKGYPEEVKTRSKPSTRKKRTEPEDRKQGDKIARKTSPYFKGQLKKKANSDK